MELTDSAPQEESAPVEQRPADPITDEVIEDKGPEIQEASYDILAQDTMNTYVDKVLEKYDLEGTEENKTKAMVALNKKLQELIESEQFFLDIDIEVETEKDLDNAVEMRGMEKTAASYKQIIQLLLEEKNGG